MARLRELHLQMVDAVLSGEGLGRVAELASSGAGGPVAILVPRLAVAVAFPEDAEIGALRRYAADRVKDRPSPLPENLVAEAPIASGDDVVGVVALLAAPGEPSPDAAEFLHLAAVAALTEVAVEEAKEEVEQNLRGSLLEELRSRPDLDPREVVRRAGRLGCDLARGEATGGLERGFRRVVAADGRQQRVHALVVHVLGERARVLAGDRGHDVARAVGGQLGAQDHRAA